MRWLILGALVGCSGGGIGGPSVYEGVCGSENAASNIVWFPYYSPDVVASAWVDKAGLGEDWIAASSDLTVSSENGLGFKCSNHLDDFYTVTVIE